MARRRGVSNAERLALDMFNVTATGTVVAASVFVYSVAFTLSDSTTSGKFSLGDSTASADLLKETSRIDFKVGSANASGQGSVIEQYSYNPPLFIANNLCWTVSTGIASVSISYLAAS